MGRAMTPCMHVCINIGLLSRRLCILLTLNKQIRPGYISSQPNELREKKKRKKQSAENYVSQCGWGIDMGSIQLGLAGLGAHSS